MPATDSQDVPPTEQHFFPTDANALAIKRTTSQVLAIVYANSTAGTKSGGFYPERCERQYQHRLGNLQRSGLGSGRYMFIRPTGELRKRFFAAPVASDAAEFILGIQENFMKRMLYVVGLLRFWRQGPSHNQASSIASKRWRIRELYPRLSDSDIDLGGVGARVLRQHHAADTARGRVEL